MKPWRYIIEQEPISLWQSLMGKIVRGEGWRRTKDIYVAISPEDSRYEGAPYEQASIFHSNAFIPGYDVKNTPFKKL